MRALVGPIGLFCLVLTGCGGSNNSGGTVNLPPASGSFSISISASSMTLVQGGAAQTIQVSATAQSGYSGAVEVATTTLPRGVSVSPVALSITPGGTPGTFTFSAAESAPVSQQNVSVVGTAGKYTSNKSLQITVTNPDPGTASVSGIFYSYGGALVHGFYDASRQILFATNPALNELDVISSKDFSLKARVPLPQPWGIDQMADGKTLVIGTKTQQIVTVDEDTLAVNQHPYAAAITNYSLVFPMVTAMANGKVLIIGQQQGIESDDILDGGQAVFTWDSISDTFTQFAPPLSNPLVPWETDSIVRSADHKWAAFSADQFYLYSSDSDSLSNASLFTVDPPDNSYGVRAYALSPDGSEIAVASGQQLTLLNSSFSVLKIVPIPQYFQTGFAMQFSADGTKLFLLYVSPAALEVITTATGSPLGFFSGSVNPDDGTRPDLFAADSAGRAYAEVNGGLRLIDLTQTPLPNPAAYAALSGPACPNLNAVLPLNTSQQVSMLNPTNGVKIYIGGQPAPLLNGGTTVTVPASATAGPANVQCVDGSGNASVVPDAVSYGADPLAFSATLLPPTGNNFASRVAYLYGFGFSASQGETPSVTLGGQPVTVASLGNLFVGTLQGEAIQIPSGSPGQSVDLTLSSTLGTGTLHSVATYYQSSSILNAASGIMQLTYDSHRNLLYALRPSEIDVLDAASQQWKSPIAFPATATGTYSSMALAPDGSALVVAGNNGIRIQLIVIDPDNPSSSSVFTKSDGGYPFFSSLAITNGNKVLVAGDPGCEFDLSSSTFSPLPAYAGQLIKSSADGSRLYGVDLNISNGQVYSLDPSTLGVQTEQFGQQYWSDLAVSADGSQFAGVATTGATPGDFVGFFDSSLRLLNTNAYPDLSPPDDIGVLGSTFSPGGKVLVVPLGDSLELWDTTTGTLRDRLITPEELLTAPSLQGGFGPLLAIDPTGQTIYAASRSGMTVMKVVVPLDQMTPATWEALHSARNSRSYGSAAPPLTAVHRHPMAPPAYSK